jgi:hypothetical protein
VLTNAILDVREALRAFIDEPDHETLVLRGREQDFALVANMLGAEDRLREDCIVSVFVAPCGRAVDYMDANARAIAEQIDAANVERDRAAMPRWAELPLAVRDPRRSPADRIRALVEHCDGLVPAGYRSVWALLPTPLTDRAGYEALVEPLLRWPFTHGRHRFVVRDDLEGGTIVTRLAEQGRDDLLVLDLDLSRARYFDDLSRVARDPRAEPRARIDAVFELTQADVTHGRWAAALEKYAALFEAYEGTDPVRQAFCLCGAAGVAMRGGQADAALRYAQQGLPIAVKTGSLAVVLPLMMLAGQACLVLGRNVDAIGYFDFANQVAAKRFDPFAKADALEQRGVAELAAGRTGAAAKTWDGCAALCREFQYEQRWRSVMGRLAALYDSAGMRAKSREVQRSLEAGLVRGEAS